MKKKNLFVSLISSRITFFVQAPQIEISIWSFQGISLTKNPIPEDFYGTDYTKIVTIYKKRRLFSRFDVTRHKDLLSFKDPHLGIINFFS